MSKVIPGINITHLTSGNGSPEACSVYQTSLGMIAKADLPGYYQNPQRPLSDIVGRRDTFHLSKGYDRFPMLKDSTGQVPYQDCSY